MHQMQPLLFAKCDSDIQCCKSVYIIHPSYELSSNNFMCFLQTRKYMKDDHTVFVLVVCSLEFNMDSYLDLLTSQFAVLYEARSNTGIDRMKIINAVAKCVPQAHKVDLKNPDKTIIVQIAKTICLIGVVKRYKELAKFNLRQLTSSAEDTKIPA
uniref:THUMP domain-containing protein n=1 Tax=Arundo donax TaxID=35708 RepID=A0A0A9DYY4_ARUDO